jgi:oligo-1,6-glucosidase
MENMEFSSLDQIDDVSSIDEYHVARDAGLSDEEALHAVSRYSRDNARTPMQWDASETAGFSEGTPWLSVNPKKDQINVASQIGRADSVLSFYKKLIALRKSPEYKNVLVYGDFISCAVPEKNLMAYMRDDGEKRLLIAANYQSKPQTVPFDGTLRKIILTNEEERPLSETISENELHLSGYQAVIVELAKK